ncbi:MAG: SWIM zinc finger family protein [Anaerolineae bacterium]
MRAGRGNAVVDKWRLLARNDDFAWGVFPNNKKEPFHTSLVLAEMGLTCTCSSQKAPCRHGLALLILLNERPDAFTTAVSPPWLTRQHQRHRSRQRRKPVSKPPSQKLQLLRSGMSELELWLRDLIRSGLADLPQRPKSYWTQMADRMIDAEAPTIAYSLRAIAKVPVKQPNWPETYLRHLSRFYLFVQGFKEWDNLAPEIQADLQTAVGWLPPPANGNPVTDEWLVLGRTLAVFGPRRWHTTWLWGTETNRPAALTQDVRPGRLIRHFYATGSRLQGGVSYASGSWPLLAHLSASQSLHQQAKQTVPGYASIQTAMKVVAQSKAASPWLDNFPLLLQHVLPMQINDTWQIVDEDGFALPLVQPQPHRWHLTAFSNGRFLPLFGLWNGTVFTPLTVGVDHKWLDLRVLRGVR